MENRNGFILKDLLIALCAIMIVFPLVISIAQTVSNFKLFDERIADMIALEAMKRKLVIVKDFKVYDDKISYADDDHEWTLKYDDERLYLTPGYQLILNNIDDLHFFSDDGLIFMTYRKDGHYHEEMLTIL